RSIRAAWLSMRYVSSSRAGMDCISLAACTTALASGTRARLGSVHDSAVSSMSQVGHAPTPDADARILRKPGEMIAMAAYDFHLVVVGVVGPGCARRCRRRGSARGSPSWRRSSGTWPALNLDRRAILARGPRGDHKIPPLRARFPPDDLPDRPDRVHNRHSPGVGR